MTLIGLTDSDEAALARLVAAYESGEFTRRPSLPSWQSPRVYEAIPFINDANETIPAYGVMRVTTPTTVDGEMVVNVAKPDATYRWRYLINTQEEVVYGGRGWGTWVLDADKVLKDTATTPAVGEHWGPKDDSFLLWQHRPGFIVDGRYDATEGVLWAQQVIPGEVRVQNDTGSPIAAGGTGTVNLFGGAAGTTDLGLEVAVTNGSSTSWASTKYGWATADAGGLIFVSPYQT